MSPSDFRVAEVRLLRDSGAVGEVYPERERAKDNLLIRGDSLNALNSLLNLPEFAAEYAGKVKLVYIDPPFNTQQAFEHYDDALEHSVWLTMMRDRLRVIKSLLSEDGSVWVHCDDSEQAYLKAMMDEVFTRDCFVAAIAWEKVYSPRMDAQQFSSSHDYILVYSRLAGWRPNGFRIEPDLRQFPFADETGRRFRRDSLRKWGKGAARSDRPNLWYPIEHDGVVYYPIRPDGTEGRWRWEQSTYEARKNQVDWLDRGNGIQPYLRQYAEESVWRPPETLWGWEEAGHNHEAKEELKTLLNGAKAFDTPKPERLLQRVVHVGSDPNDIVLDCFLGSGTTAAVAHKMGRRWVGIEWSDDTVATFAAPRLTKVVRGEDPGGISKAAGWTGGGGFRCLDVAPSMFEARRGEVFLSEWVTNGKLSETAAAQLGFEYVADPPFSGAKGRTRLAVVDGFLSRGVAELILRALPEGQTVTACATSVDPEAADLIRGRSPGSTVRRIPQAILREYRRKVTRQARAAAAESEPASAEDAQSLARSDIQAREAPVIRSRGRQEELPDPDQEQKRGEWAL